MINFLGASSFSFLSIFILWRSKSIPTNNAFLSLLPYTTNHRHDILTATKDFLRRQHDNHSRFSRNNNHDDDDKEPSIIMEVKILQARAKELRREARAMELALRESCAKKRKDKELITDEIIAEIFSPLNYQKTTATINNDNNNNDGSCTEENSESMTSVILTDARIVADRLKHGAFSRQQILSVVNRLMYFERYQVDVDSVDQDLDNNVDKEKSYVLEEEQHYNETTVNDGVYNDYLVVLLQASVLLDQQFDANVLQEKRISYTSSSSMNPKPSSSLSTLMTNGKLEKVIQSRILKLRQLREVERNRRITAETNRIAAISDGTNGTVTTLIESKASSFIPMWVPSTFVPYILSLYGEESSSSSPDTLGPTEVEILKNEVLLGSRFYLTSFESMPGAALFR